MCKLKYAKWWCLSFTILIYKRIKVLSTYCKAVKWVIMIKIVLDFIWIANMNECIVMLLN